MLRRHADHPTPDPTRQTGDQRRAHGFDHLSHPLRMTAIIGSEEQDDLARTAFQPHLGRCTNAGIRLLHHHDAVIALLP